MTEYIKQHLPIDIALDKENNTIYSGICIKSNKYVFIIVNYNYKINEFDGYTVFRNKDVHAYWLWESDEKANIINNNFKEFMEIIDFEKMNSFYSALKEASKTGAIAFFTDIKDKDYYEGIVVSMDRNNVTFQLVDQDKKYTNIETFSISDIAFFGFGTIYEKELLKQMT